MLLTDLMDALEAGMAKWTPEGFARTLYEGHASPSACWEGIRLSPFHQPSLQALKQRAKSFSGKPAASLPFSLYRLFDETGQRTAYQTCYFEHRARLNTFALLSLAGETDALSSLEDAIWAICDEYTWCLPAHLGGRSLLPSAVPGNGMVALREQTAGMDASGQVYRVHDREVDLFAAETASALAEISALLAEQLSPVVLARARAQVLARVLVPVSGYGPAFTWETLSNNWSAVCAGAVGIAAMYLVTDSRTLAPILQRCLAAMAVFLSGFAADGACTEGLGYWHYGFGYYVAFAERLSRLTCGRMDLMSDEKIHQIALFQQRVWLGGDQVVSFSDGDVTGRWHPGLTHALCRRYPDVQAPSPDCVHRFGDDPCHRWVMDLRDFLWAEPTRTSLSQRDTGSVWMADAAWLISRVRIPSGLVAFAAKGGHNAEPHNHNDLGTFLLHMDGETLLTDTGAGEYTKGYFGNERYDYLVSSSFGHSVPEVGGQGQRDGLPFHADVIQISRGTERDVLALDLTAAYGMAALVSLTRTFLWNKNAADPSLIIEDRLVQDRTPLPVTERFVSFYEPEITGDGVWIRGRKAALCLSLDMPETCGGVPGDNGSFVPRVDRQVFKGHHGEERVLWRVNFTCDLPQGDCLFRVRIKPVAV